MGEGDESTLPARSRPSPHVAHAVAVEAGLGAPELGAKLLKRMPYGRLAGTSIPFVSPARRTLTNLLTSMGKTTGLKAFGKVPVIGTGIDLLTSSPIAPERQLVEEDRAREAARRRQEPRVEQGVEYEDGSVYFPETRKWLMPPTAIGHSRGPTSQRSRPASFDWRGSSIPPPALQQTFRPDRPGQPGWGLEVTRSRPFDWRGSSIPPPALQQTFRPDRPGQPGWGLEVTRSRPFDWRGSSIPPPALQQTFRPDRPGQPGWGLEVPRSRPPTPQPGSLEWMAGGLR